MKKWVAVGLGILFILPKHVLANEVCKSDLSKLYLSGGFLLPGSGETVQLSVGKGKEENPQSKVIAFLADPRSSECLASCHVTRFERFAKDHQPALMEMDCEGPKLRTLKMPIHVQWVRSETNPDHFDTVVRLGSAIYGMEQADFRVAVNRYSAPGELAQSKSKTQAPAPIASGVKKTAN